MALLLGIAGQAGLAISNARLHQRMLNQQLIEQDLIHPVFRLESDVLKWPHHIWLPQSEQTITRFLMTVRPQVVIFSNIGSGQKRTNLDGARQLIERVLDHAVQVFWTFTDGTVRVITLRSSRSPIPALSHCEHAPPSSSRNQLGASIALQSV